jgi:hypothetical protein
MILGVIYFIYFRCRLYNMYNLHYVSTTLGVQSWKEIISGGTRTKNVEYHWFKQPRSVLLSLKILQSQRSILILLWKGENKLSLSVCVVCSLIVKHKRTYCCQLHSLPCYPHLVPRSRMSRSYTSSPPSASMPCRGTALHFTRELSRQEQRQDLQQ